ncbi:hypothetical protein SAY87_021058 [Trapa incisa]|uniref:WAT1-related protein n=1 Tax=Trapa incisa TaxID=236973 RepID=A0AAN7JSC9_9MYRT|nr:hypothetical protein SAY87_021058 [Trapa incisa]
MDAMSNQGFGFDEWKPFIVMIVIEMCFAGVNVLLKTVLDQGINHLVLITYRLFISAVFLAPVGYFWERSTRPKLTFRILCYLFVSAIVGSSLTQYLYLLGIQYTSATFSCAFINIVPVITFIMALPFRTEKVDMKERSGRAKVLGTLICIGGAMVLILYKGPALFNSSHPQQYAPTSHSPSLGFSPKKRAERWSIGLIGLGLGTLFWSSWFLIQASIARRFPCQYSSTVIMSFFGSIQSSVLAFATGNDLSIWVLKGKAQILTVVYAGMVGSGLCFVGMAWCVKKRGPVFTAAFSPLIQIMSAMLDIPILHEQLHIGSIVGSIIVIIGLYFLLWGKNKEMQKCATKIAQEEEELDVEVKVQEQEEEPSTRNHQVQGLL